ncbi:MULTISPECIES: hypothetical protein [Acinetobacter]|jgi:hypothetical protein|uniref:Uncharacterized protein n=1 Tax=Acinetobacter bouvetii TaxID=202951 RepID=A0A4Q7AWQ2_9GAMM|nr:MULTISPECIES: hypothetical protein [Acinetobacter]RZG66836.1 hypothetical protein EXE25_09120 [Acinetobacter bouvetii]TCB76175.1 hypothetical protein E0H91_02585 [Acinetobacter sp. ANC 4177]
MSSLSDLRTHLFSQLDRLGKADKENLQDEIARSEAIRGVSDQIIKAHDTQLKAVALVATYKGMGEEQKPAVIPGSYLEIEGKK